MYTLIPRDIRLGKAHESSEASILTQGNPAVDDSTAEFLRMLAGFTPRVFLAWTVVLINVGLFAAMVISGFNYPDFLTEILLRWGADFGPKTITGGEWWRVVTCMFVHAGLLHLGFNMLILFQIGPFIERLLGKLGFIVVYFVSGIAGSFTSLAWHPYVVSEGASGAIFGLYGALVGLISFRKDSIPKQVLQNFRSGALVFIAYNIVFGTIHKGTDVAAHVGGLCAGLLCGAVISTDLRDRFVYRRAMRAAAVALVSIAAFGLAAAMLPRPTE